MLDTLNASGVKRGGCVLLVSVLDLAAILDFPTSVRGQLWFFWRLVVQGNKEISNVIFHGQAASPVGVVWSVGPGQVNTGEFLALPVLGDCVVLLEVFCKVVSIILPRIFHTKIIHD